MESSLNLPPYINFPVIRSNRMDLRQINEKDGKDLVEISFYDAKPALNEQEALVMLNRIHEDYLLGTSIHWGIAEKPGNKIVGTCGFYRGFNNKTGEIGCVLRPNFYGKGWMTQALQLLIDYGFFQMNLNRIIAITSEQNIRAQKLLNRLHFTPSGQAMDASIEYELLKEQHVLYL